MRIATRDARRALRPACAAGRHLRRPPFTMIERRDRWPPVTLRPFQAGTSAATPALFQDRRAKPRAIPPAGSCWSAPHAPPADPGRSRRSLGGQRDPIDPRHAARTAGLPDAQGELGRRRDVLRSLVRACAGARRPRTRRQARPERCNCVSWADRPLGFRRATTPKARTFGVEVRSSRHSAPRPPTSPAAGGRLQRRPLSRDRRLPRELAGADPSRGRPWSRSARARRREFIELQSPRRRRRLLPGPGWHRAIALRLVLRSVDSTYLTGKRCSCSATRPTPSPLRAFRARWASGRRPRHYSREQAPRSARPATALGLER